MTEHDEDQAELAAARRAIHAAQMGTVRTDAVVNAIHSSSKQINSIVQANGYVNRFRQVLRGTN